MATSDIQSRAGMSFAGVAEVERVYDHIYQRERSLIREFKALHTLISM